MGEGTNETKVVQPILLTGNVIHDIYAYGAYLVAVAQKVRDEDKNENKYKNGKPTNNIEKERI